VRGIPVEFRRAFWPVRDELTCRWPMPSRVHHIGTQLVWGGGLDPVVRTLLMLMRRRVEEGDGMRLSRYGLSEVWGGGACRSGPGMGRRLGGVGWGGRG